MNNNKKIKRLIQAIKNFRSHRGKIPAALPAPGSKSRLFALADDSKRREDIQSGYETANKGRLDQSTIDYWTERINFDEDRRNL